MTWPFRHKSEPRIFYGWYIAFAGANSNWLILGLSLFGFGVFFEPLRNEMGWTAAAVAAGHSIRSAESGMLAPLAGYLIDRLGSRRMAITGAVILGSGLLWFSQIHHLWEYFLASTVIALGQSMGAVAPYQAALMNWFVKKRGRAIGILQAGNVVAVVLAESLDKPFPWAVGFLFGNTELSLELWNIIAGISGFDD